METLVRELLWFLPWCWFVNVSLNALWYFFKSHFPVLLRIDRSFDCGSTFFDKKPLLGTSTTWGGLIQVVVLGGVGEYFFPHHFFFILAVGVFFGHALGSFIKRRLGIPRGGFLFGVDHADYIWFCGLLSIGLGTLSLGSFVVALILSYALTPLLTFSSYLLRIRAEKL